MKKISLAFLSLFVLAALTACVGTFDDSDVNVVEESDSDNAVAEEAVSDEPISYQLSVDANVTVNELTFGDLFTVDGLKMTSTECGVEREDGYFEDLMAKMAGETVYQYVFTYAGESQRSNSYTVDVVANAAGYDSSVTFTEDFGVCAVGGMYPQYMNTDWLTFEAGCGSGYDDGSGLPIGCDEVKKNIEISLN